MKRRDILRNRSFIFYFVWKKELSIDQFILLYIVRVINWATQKRVACVDLIYQNNNK